MLFRKFLVIVFLISTTLMAQKLKTDIDSVSYSIGFSIGQNFQAQDLDINYDVLIKAIKHALDKKKPILSDDVMTNTIVAFQTKKRAEQEEENKKIGVKNRRAGESFLAKNKKMPGVQVTKTGLQYKVLEYGKGDSPKKTDKVKVHYKGTLVDGREFDSSYKRGEPIEFQVTGVIAGWTEALQMMSVGSKWELYIPSDLAYGNRKRSELIGPNSTLIFTVELLGITPSK